MPLVIEDGTGVDGANSYATVAEADAFYADRNILNWAGAGATNAQKEGFLIQAADYLNMFFRWRGEPLLADQSMGLPTVTYDYVPVPVKQAQILLAREAVSGPLFTSLGERPVTLERKQLQGVGEKEVRYAENNVDPFGRVGSAVTSMLLAYTYAPGWIQQARVDRG